MCATCGCEGNAETTLTDLQTGQTHALGTVQHEHVHADGTRHMHAHDHEHHDHDHVHGHDRQHGTTIDIQARILAKNDGLAAQNRAWLRGREILALNLVSSPGSGKTALLERTIALMAGEAALFVIEGDQATSNDGERIRAAGAPAVQVNTGSGCHLDAEMVRRGLAELRPSPGSVVLIENVGNLVCPALFDLGERAKVAIFSVTEGEDKPLKYPHMFRAAGLVLLNKIDLLPHLDFSVAEATANVRRVNPDATILEVSARTGEGLPGWLAWLKAEAAAARGFAIP
ncbi:MAG TPA: hydrogenase nickel incorporation protein HypB [Stellaceae bacterium]|jgi:hydrogenase nickel incorporation protein HypB|nr:hydrogenase nickel incorporation protein HypB [Stellaceae bacterium]